MGSNELKAPSLYELTADLQMLLDMGYPEINEKDDDELKEAKEKEIEVFDETLAMILECIADKADGYCHVMDRFNWQAKMVKAEIERLADKKKALENAYDRMKERLKQALEAMESQGIEKPEIRTGLHTIKLAGNGGKQPMKVAESMVPDNFKKVILETDNDKIRKALEGGEKLDFAELLPRGRHVSIR